MSECRVGAVNQWKWQPDEDKGLTKRIDFTDLCPFVDKFVFDSNDLHKHVLKLINIDLNNI